MRRTREQLPENKLVQSFALAGELLHCDYLLPSAAADNSQNHFYTEAQYRRGAPEFSRDEFFVPIAFPPPVIIERANFRDSHCVMERETSVIILHEILGQYNALLDP